MKTSFGRKKISILLRWWANQANKILQTWHFYNKIWVYSEIPTFVLFKSGDTNPLVPPTFKNEWGTYPLLLPSTPLGLFTNLLISVLLIARLMQWVTRFVPQTIPVWWLLFLQLTVLSRSAIAVIKNILVACSWFTIACFSCISNSF